MRSYLGLQLPLLKMFSEIKEVQPHSQNPAWSCKALQIDGTDIIRENAFDMELERWLKKSQFLESSTKT